MNQPPSPRPHKIPRSALVVIHNDANEVLLIERTDHPGYWQSVTGSQDPGETWRQTAIREVKEETGINAAMFQLADWHEESEYEIYAIWRHRYAPGVTHNLERVFGLCVPQRVAVTLDPREHLQHVWLPIEAAAALCFSATNRAAILSLPARATANADSGL